MSINSLLRYFGLKANKSNIITRKKKIADKIKRGYSDKYGYLHIPKTGGTSINFLGHKIVSMGYSYPVSIGHSWKMREIRSVYPDMKIAVILRDPLERMISGFNSRLRQGRPTYNNVWTPAEAVAMAMHPSSRHFLDNMLSDDEYSTSAVAYAFKYVTHLRWNYCYYFENADFAKECMSSIEVVGHMSHFNDFACEMVKLSNAPVHLVNDHLESKHRSSEITSSVLDHYTPGEISRLKEKLAAEYAIYHELSKLLPEKVLKNMH